MFKIEEIKEDVPNVVSFSGGRTSAFMVWLFEKAKKKNPKIQVEYVFCDTGAEHPKTYEFIRNVVDHFGIELTCLRSVMSDVVGVGPKFKEVSLEDIGPDLGPFRQMAHCYGLPQVLAPKCTEVMKTEPFSKYANQKYGRGKFVRWLGIRVDEPKRLKKVYSQLDLFGGEKKEKGSGFRYLAQISEMTKTDILFFWGEMPFDLEIPEYLGNCVFCVKKPLRKIAIAAKEEPALLADFLDLIDDPKNRVKESTLSLKGGHKAMYREAKNLEEVVEMFSHETAEDLISKLRSPKYKDDNLSCGESCEAMFSPDDFDLEMQ